MKILVTGDWHIGVTSFGVINDCGQNSRLLDVANIIGKISTFAQEQSVDLVVHCGDFFHTNRPTTDEQLILYHFFHTMHMAGIEVRGIIGNHDYNSQRGKGHALKLFMRAFDQSKVKIYDTTTVEMIGDHRFIFYPFAGESPDFAKIVTGEPAARNILVCHSHLEGAVVGAEPFEIKDDRATKFRELPLDCVFAGHFHKAQLLGDNPLAFYPGSIQSVDFNERMDVKGVVLVDTEEMSLHPAGFKTRPMVQLDYDDSNLEGLVNDPEIKDAIVKVNWDLSEQNAHKFDENKVREWCMERGAHSIAAITLNVRRSEVKRDPTIKIDSDVRSNFLRYLKQKDYGDLQEEVQAEGCSIIEECAS